MFFSSNHSDKQVFDKMLHKAALGMISDTASLWCHLDSFIRSVEELTSSFNFLHIPVASSVILSSVGTILKRKSKVNVLLLQHDPKNHHIR